MKKNILTLLFLVFFSAIIFTGCNEKEEKNLTNAQKLAESFKEEIKSKDIEKVANELSKSELIEFAVESFKVEKGEYLTGFTKEITGFKKAYGIRPFIGSIPFISYIFETDKPKELSENLKESADLRWNICTEADYMEVAIVDNYVFFVMMPKDL